MKIISATPEQIENRKEAFELLLGYVDRATYWWTDWLTDEVLIHNIMEDVLPDLWNEFDRAILRPVWTYPVELVARLDKISAMVGKDPVVRNIQRTKDAFSNYCEVI